jgi:hypothetical protein
MVGIEGELVVGELARAAGKPIGGKIPTAVSMPLIGDQDVGKCAVE